MKKNNYIFFIVCFFSFGLPLTSFSQKPEPAFQVVHLPRKTEYSKDKLNEEVTKAKDKEAVRRIIRLKNFPSAQIIIQIKNKDNQYSWWTLNTTTGYEKEDNDIILQSKTGHIVKSDSAAKHKAARIPVVQHPGDFNKIFKDTLLLADTLFVSLELNDNDHPYDGYQFTFACSNGKIGSEKIPAKNKKLVLAGSLFQSCNENFQAFSLYNKKNPSERLAYCIIRFLTAEEKEAILSMASYYRKTNPGATIDKITGYASAYIATQSASPLYPQLLHWLETNLRNK